MIDPAIVGKRITSSTHFTVNQDAITRFCQAISERDDSIAPPTFSFTFIIAAFEETLKGAGVDWSRMVHGDQRFEIREPIKAGDRLSISSTVESVRSAAGNELVTVRADIEREGQEIIHAWSTLVVRG